MAFAARSRLVRARGGSFIPWLNTWSRPYRAARRIERGKSAASSSNSTSRLSRQGESRSKIPCPRASSIEWAVRRSISNSSRAASRTARKARVGSSTNKRPCRTRIRRCPRSSMAPQRSSTEPKRPGSRESARVLIVKSLRARSSATVALSTWGSAAGCAYCSLRACATSIAVPSSRTRVAVRKREWVFFSRPRPHCSVRRSPSTITSRSRVARPSKRSRTTPPTRQARPPELAARRPSSSSAASADAEVQRRKALRTPAASLPGRWLHPSSPDSTLASRRRSMNPDGSLPDARTTTNGVGPAFNVLRMLAGEASGATTCRSATSRSESCNPSRPNAAARSSSSRVNPPINRPRRATTMTSGASWVGDASAAATVVVASSGGESAMARLAARVSSVRVIIRSA